MTSLPPEVPKRLRDIADVVSAYNICLAYEKSLQLAIDNGDDVGNKQIYIRNPWLPYTLRAHRSRIGKPRQRNQLVCR